MNDKSAKLLFLGIAAPLVIGVIVLCGCGGLVLWMSGGGDNTQGITNYKVLERIELRGSPVTVEVSVPGLTKQTPIAEIEAAAKEIAEREDAEKINLFSTWSAWKAQYSESYMRAHPEAREGFLGVYQNGKFTTR